jgi:hypothetical protein
MPTLSGFAAGKSRVPAASAAQAQSAAQAAEIDGRRRMYAPGAAVICFPAGQDIRIN